MPIMNEHEALQMAIVVGSNSPCMKSKRGVILFKRDAWLAVAGNNYPADPLHQCDNSEACRLACPKVCVHAEQSVILKALFDNIDIVGMELLHVKVVNGEAAPSGEPSCWQCSKLLCDSGLAGIWLLHEDGLRKYEPMEFHRATLSNCGLPNFRISTTVKGADEQNPFLIWKYHCPSCNRKYEWTEDWTGKTCPGCGRLISA